MTTTQRSPPGLRSAAEIESIVREYFASGPGDAIAAYLFGSMGRGTASASSDVDLAVLYREAPPRVLGAVPQRQEAALERALRRPVQVIVLNTAPPDLVHRVLRDGRLLLDRDPGARVSFEVQARNAYFDMEPIRKLYRLGGLPL